VPAVTFLLLYLWPFLEQRLTRDPAAHQLLDRPRDHPVRCAAGVATLTFYGLLLAAASNDVIAKLAGVPVGGLTWAGRILLVAAPPVAAVVAYVLARALRDSGVKDVMHLSFQDVTGTVRATLQRPQRRTPRRRRRAPARIAGGSEHR
jgi:ubiquinol-cytochrome c reductase cytochrome b subunit